MRDNLRRYRAIREAFTPWYPRQPSGTVARHLLTLAALRSGIVGSQRTQLPHLAAKVPNGSTPASRVQRFARWMRHDRRTEEVSFVPYAPVLLAHLALHTLVLIMDGRVVGRGGVALMLPVVSQGRALPLAWQVRQGKKGPVPADLHSALVKQVQTLSPLGASVVVLGAGACDGTTLQPTVQHAHWSSVVRTGRHRTGRWDGERVRGETVAACIKPGTLVARPDGHVTAAAYGPVRRLCCWAKGYQAPLHLLTTIPSADEACRLYAKRLRIETCFSDPKSRGFHLHTSPLADPTRLARLLLAAC